MRTITAVTRSDRRWSWRRCWPRKASLGSQWAARPLWIECGSGSASTAASSRCRFAMEACCVNLVPCVALLAFRASRGCSGHHVRCRLVAASPLGRVMRLEPRALHAGRGPQPGRRGGLRPAPRQGPHLPRGLHGQLVARAADGRLRHRCACGVLHVWSYLQLLVLQPGRPVASRRQSMTRVPSPLQCNTTAPSLAIRRGGLLGGERQALFLQVPRRRRQRLPPRGHHAPRDHPRRHRGGGQPQRRGERAWVGWARG